MGFGVNKMLKVDREFFQRSVVQIVELKEIEELVREFSLNRVFFYSLLTDLALGKDSSNYQVLKELARDRRIDEQHIVERASSIISYLTQDGQEQDYAKRFPALPIVVGGHVMDVISDNFVYLSLVLILILVLTFYTLQSGMLFRSQVKAELSHEAEQSKLPTDSLTLLNSEQRQNEKANLPGEIAKLTKEETRNIRSEVKGNITPVKVATNVNTINKGKDEFPNTTKTNKELPTGITYVVKKGDTLWGLATRFKTSVDELRTINNLGSNGLNIGKVLLVPRNESSVGNEGVERNQTEQESKVKNDVKELERSITRQQITPEDKKQAEFIRDVGDDDGLYDNKEALRRGGIETKNRETITTDSAIKTTETELQESAEEEKVSVQKQEDAQKELNIPKTTTHFENDSIKDIKFRLWNSDRNILGPE